MTLFSLKEIPKEKQPPAGGRAAILDADESGALSKFQSQTWKAALYWIRRMLEEKEIPQGSAAGSNHLNFDWEMSQPLLLLTSHGVLPDPEIAEDESSVDKPCCPEPGTQPAASPRVAAVDVPADSSNQTVRPEDPVPMSLDSDGPVFASPPSDESRTQLYGRTCGDTAPANQSGGREKRSRPPDFFPGKRLNVTPFGCPL